MQMACGAGSAATPSIGAACSASFTARITSARAEAEVDVEVDPHPVLDRLALALAEDGDRLREQRGVGHDQRVPVAGLDHRVAPADLAHAALACRSRAAPSRRRLIESSTWSATPPTTLLSVPWSENAVIVVSSALVATMPEKSNPARRIVTTPAAR